jgi:hypothetical protein
MKMERVLFILLSIALICSGIALAIIARDVNELQEENQLQQDNLEYVYEEVLELQPTQMQRYFYSLIDEVVLNGEVEFIELDTLYTGSVEGWGYSAYVLELEQTTMVSITIEFKNTFLDWYDGLVDIHLYYGGITDPDVTYAESPKKETYTVAMQKGFNTIEFDSYSDKDWEFTIIVEVNE